MKSQKYLRYCKGIFLLLVIMATFFSLSCSALHTEVGPQFSTYKQTGNIVQLFKETTLHIPRPGDAYRGIQSKIPFYNATGHGYFDTLTVMAEYLCYKPLALTGDLPYKGSMKLRDFYFNLRNIEDPTEMKVWDWAPYAALTYPAQGWKWLFNSAGLAAVYVYDVRFHDTPIAIWAALTYPYKVIKRAVTPGSEKDMTVTISELPTAPSDHPL
jgi:hypothetical protein